MSQLVRVNEILSAVGQRDSLVGLALDSAGCLAIRLPNGVGLHFEWIEQHAFLFLYTPICSLASSEEASRDGILERLLRLNCLAHAEQFALHPSSQQVLLQRGIHFSNLTVKSLDEAINQLLARRAVVLLSLREYSEVFTAVV